MRKFYKTLREVLLQDDRLKAQDGTLLRNYAFELGEKTDENLLKLLLENEETNKHFFKKVGDVMVFDKRKFCWVVNNRQFLPDSYTRFANKIGLIDDMDKFIAQTNNVQLAFPYKDCLLEGGQTKDDQKRNEIFWNELLAPDECDRLLEPKVLCNAKRFFYAKTEPQSLDCEIAAQSKDCGSAFENLLLKGNNLLALSSLEKVYAGKIKLIYIDPPYNTGNDSFLYNDRFNHAAWLTFMKNRLVIAKRLLRDDGSIWIQADDNEAHYLKVLADEILGRENFVCDIAWEKRYAPPPDTKGFGYIHDHILCYRRSDKFERNLLPLTEDQEGRYKNPDNDPRGPWKATDYTCRYSVAERPNLYYAIRQPNTGEKIFPKKNRVWAMSREVHQRYENEGRIWWGSTGKNAVPALKNFISEIQQGMMPMSLWKHSFAGHTQDAKKESMLLFPNRAFSTPKPEKLLRRIIEIASQPGDLVLDFFAGSGTTLAVAHKMGRRWIGIEQMDYIESVTVERMKKVMEGEQGGISKSVGWQGGGSFIYCELAAHNVGLIDRIGRAKTAAELSALWKDMQNKHCYDYRINLEATEGFESLSLADKKRFLLDALDKDTLYVNLSDIDDESYGIKEEDKEFTRKFYDTGFYITETIHNGSA